MIKAEMVPFIRIFSFILDKRSFSFHTQQLKTNSVFKLKTLNCSNVK